MPVTPPQLRWPIRNQIFLPFAVLLLTAVLGNALFSAALASRRREQETIERLEQIAETLIGGNFPLTENVLRGMKGLSGAEYLLLARSGTVAAATLPVAGDALDPLLLNPPPYPFVPGSTRPIVSLGGVRYVAAAIRRSAASNANQVLVVLYPEAHWLEERWQAVLPPLAVGLGTIVLGGGLSLHLAQRFSERIGRVQRRTARIAAGDFTEIPLSGPQDEIRELASGVNLMCGQLRRITEKIIQLERERLLGQLAGGMAHQLRNAVTGARLALQIHARRCTPAPGDESVRVALEQLVLTEEQVRRFLAAGREPAAVARRFAVQKMVHDLLDFIRPVCQHLRVTIDAEILGDPGDLTGDEDQLRGAVLNLLLNAIEAASGGKVTFRTNRTPAEVAFEVIDDGPGPPPHLAETLFDPFVTGKPEGVGLGLAVARQVAVDHGGRLDWSRSGGKTTFSLALPVGDLAEVNS